MGVRIGAPSFLIKKHDELRWFRLTRVYGLRYERLQMIRKIPARDQAEDFQPLHLTRAIENGRRNRVRHLNSPSVRELHLRGR